MTALGQESDSRSSLHKKTVEIRHIADVKHVMYGLCGRGKLF